MLYYLILLVFIGSIILQGAVNSTFEKYSRVASSRGYTGADVARMLLNSYGVNDVSVVETSGTLTDHYDPTDKVIRLSQAVYGSSSVAALGVAAHETGHALQHNKGYQPFEMRSDMFPVVSFSSKAYLPIFIAGLFLASITHSTWLALVGVILFAFVVAFQLITLPVEFDASQRALKMLVDNNFLDDREINGARAVLKVAALTYVAAVASSILQLLRFIGIARRYSRRD